MVSKPKLCKYGCETLITWNDVNRYFMGPDNQKHDCRDWPGVGGNAGGAGQVQVSPSSNPAGGGTYSTAAGPSAETLIGVQAKKTWENYFKLLEPILANLSAIASSTEEINKHLMELGNKIKSLEDTMTIQRGRIDQINKRKQEAEEEQEIAA